MDRRIVLSEDNVKTMEFFRMLMKRSKEAEDNPHIQIPLNKKSD
jgi:hypothetical protein